MLLSAGLSLMPNVYPAEPIPMVYPYPGASVACVHVCACLYTGMCAHMWVCLFTYVHTCMCTYVCLLFSHCLN